MNQLLKSALPAGNDISYRSQTELSNVLVPGLATVILMPPWLF
ncbi:protein of unknown function [Candidatus Methylacidiphilum fumarolicum]|uniref:Uncharacterized protein n=1 Tax=Candidatus Methylacidiphilum fumarolicum TaxID=591154 RepID=A0ABN8XF67_9BACT|nr:protein of unknown function [Candidatus Methylacidiphilum fumarolicum]